MDAFAVSVCKGISMKKMSLKKAGIIGIMPWLGYFLGTTFEGVVTNIDHWIAFILLSIIGIKMVKESFSKEIKNYNDDVSFKTMLIL